MMAAHYQEPKNVCLAPGEPGNQRSTVSAQRPLDAPCFVRCSSFIEINLLIRSQGMRTVLVGSECLFWLSSAPLSHHCATHQLLDFFSSSEKFRIFKCLSSSVSY